MIFYFLWNQCELFKDVGGGGGELVVDDVDVVDGWVMEYQGEVNMLVGLGVSVEDSESFDCGVFE